MPTMMPVRARWKSRLPVSLRYPDSALDARRVVAVEAEPLALQGGPCGVKRLVGGEGRRELDVLVEAGQPGGCAGRRGAQRRQVDPASAARCSR